MTEPAFVAVAASADVPEEGSREVQVGGRAILLCRSEGGLYAVENLCSHAQQTLECGRVRWGWIACPAHGARFDLATGEPLNPPASEPIATFPVREVDGVVEVAA